MDNNPEVNYIEKRQIVLIMTTFVFMVFVLGFMAIDRWYWSLYTKKEQEKLNDVTKSIMLGAVHDLEKSLGFMNIMRQNTNLRLANVNCGKVTELHIDKNWQPKVLQNPRLFN